MDIAEMIVSHAKELERKDKESNFLEFKLHFHLHAQHEDEDCINEDVGFTIQPLKSDHTKIAFVYKNTKWIQSKSSKYIFKLTKIILRQMIKDVIDKIDRVLFEANVSLTVFYKKEVLFTDEHFIDEDINAIDLGIHNITDCNDNEDLKQLQDMMIGYMETCLNMEF